MIKYMPIILILSILTFNSCEEEPESNIVEPPQSLIPLTPDSLQILSINDFSVELLHDGTLQMGKWKNGSETISNIFLAGLWIGFNQGGYPKGDIISEGTLIKSNYTSTWGRKDLGVFYFDGSDSYENTDWPADFGAPVNSDRSPLIYGDAMCWSALQSDTSLSTTPILAHPIRKLRVTQALYAYKRTDLSNVIFIRYDITNLSDQKWNDIYLGFFSDTDLYWAYTNHTGYDSLRGLTYTYEDSLNRYVTGFTFLETPDNKGVYSHRIMRKNNYLDPDFGEYGLIMPEQILYVLHGLSNSAHPMINPVTGTETLFAFTGDPVSGTGWLDVRVDVRSMITSGPFSLNPYESKTVTVVWEANDGADLQDALQKLKSKIDQIRSEPGLWRFN